MKTRDTVAIITAYNESEKIAETVNAVKQIEAVKEVYVIDDGSIDETAKLAADAGAEIIKFNQNLGKGQALAKALNLIKPKVSEDIILLLDGDIGQTAREASKLIKIVSNGYADMAIADLPKPARKGGFGLAKGLAKLAIKLLAGISTKEPLSGQRAIKRKFLQEIAIEPGFGVEVGLTIDLARKGCRIIEIPLSMRHKETGRDLASFLHRGKQFLAVVRVAAKRVFKRY
jgi:glycosyltransferase involved in cell wall biosynthesis